MTDMTKEELLNYLVMMAERVHDEYGISYDALMGYTPEELYAKYQPVSGQAVSFEPFMNALAVAGLVAVTLGAGIGVLQTAGLIGNLSSELLTAPVS